MISRTSKPTKRSARVKRPPLLAPTAPVLRPSAAATASRPPRYVFGYCSVPAGSSDDETIRNISLARVVDCWLDSNEQLLITGVTGQGEAHQRELAQLTKVLAGKCLQEAARALVRKKPRSKQRLRAVQEPRQATPGAQLKTNTLARTASAISSLLEVSGAKDSAAASAKPVVKPSTVVPRLETIAADAIQLTKQALYRVAQHRSIGLTVNGVTLCNVFVRGRNVICGGVGGWRAIIGTEVDALDAHTASVATLTSTNVKGASVHGGQRIHLPTALPGQAPHTAADHISHIGHNSKGARTVGVIRPEMPLRSSTDRLMGQLAGQVQAALRPHSVSATLAAARSQSQAVLLKSESIPSFPDLPFEIERTLEFRDETYVQPTAALRMHRAAPILKQRERITAMLAEATSDGLGQSHPQFESAGSSHLPSSSAQTRQPSNSSLTVDYTHVPKAWAGSDLGRAVIQRFAAISLGKEEHAGDLIGSAPATSLHTADSPSTTVALSATRTLVPSPSTTRSPASDTLTAPMWDAVGRALKVIVPQSLGAGHTVSRNEEASRVTASGGRIVREDESGRPIPSFMAPTAEKTIVLPVTRCLGCTAALQFGLSDKPEVVSHRLTEADRFLVVANEALWQALSSDLVAHIVEAKCRSVLDGGTVEIPDPLPAAVGTADDVSHGIDTVFDAGPTALASVVPSDLGLDLPPVISASAALDPRATPLQAVVFPTIVHPAPLRHASDAVDLVEEVAVEIDAPAEGAVTGSGGGTVLPLDLIESMLPTAARLRRLERRRTVALAAAEAVVAAAMSAWQALTATVEMSSSNNTPAMLCVVVLFEN